MTRHLKTFLAITTVITLLWYMAGAFIAGSFDVTLWHGVAKFFMVLFWAIIEGIATHICFFSINSRNYIEKIYERN